MINENYEHQRIEGSSDRGFGLTVGGILGAIQLLRMWPEMMPDPLGIVLLVTAGLLVVLGLLKPSLLAPLNRAWMKVGSVMFKIVNPLVMFIIFVSTIIPTGLLLRLFGKDPMRLKIDPQANSYWIKREPSGPLPESMKNQF